MKQALLLTSALALITASAGAQAAGEVVINEFVTKNDSIGGYQEPSGGFGDWLELYNLTDAPVDLGGAWLTDTLGELEKWQFPAGTLIGAGGYLIVWVDDDEEPEKMQEGLHASFKLGSDEEIGLSRDGVIIDSYDYEDGESNVAFARRPNGTGDFVKQAPTPLASNETVGVRDAPAVELRAYPSPARDAVTVELGDGDYAHFAVYDVRGARVAAGPVARGAREVRIDVARLAPGLHVVSLDGGVAAATFTRAE